MIGSRVVTIAILLAAGASGCSSMIPKGPEPVCGPAVDRRSVVMLDMTGYRMDQDRISAAVEARVGDYRLMTGEPVWIPKRSASGDTDHAGDLATVQSIAADWGCNLLLLLDRKMEQPGVRLQGRKEKTVWLVHAGRLGSR